MRDQYPQSDRNPGQSTRGEYQGQGSQPMGGQQPVRGGSVQGEQYQPGPEMGGRQPMQGSQQSMGGHQPVSGDQQPMQGGQGTGGQPAPSFEDHLTSELRILLEDFSEVTHVAEWCAKECAYAGPELATCARVCEDIAEIAELNEKLIARDSPFGPQVADLFVRVATEGLPELQRHAQHHPHVTETIATIERTINSCSALLDSGGRHGFGQGVGSQQTAGQQPTGGGPGGY